MVASHFFIKISAEILLSFTSWDISFLSLQNVYKAKFEKEKGKSVYNQMIVPPDVKHAMDVAKSQSNVSELHNAML